MVEFDIFHIVFLFWIYFLIILFTNCLTLILLFEHILTILFFLLLVDNKNIYLHASSILKNLLIVHQ